MLHQNMDHLYNNRKEEHDELPARKTNIIVW